MNKKNDLPFRYNIDGDPIKIISPYFILLLFTAFFAWLITPPNEKPIIVSVAASLFCAIYITYVFIKGAMFNVLKMNIGKAMMLESLGGLFMVFLVVFGGGAAYLWISKPVVAIVVTMLYLPPCIYMAYKKHNEVELKTLLQDAKIKKAVRYNSYSFSLSDFPDCIPQKQKILIHSILTYPPLILAVVALAFSRSDWKYEIASPLMGVCLLSMLYIIAYGNIVSTFYWIEYLRNKEKYAEFENWPREQFIERS